MENWLDKYTPSNLNGVIGDKKTIVKIVTFIKKFDEENDKDKILNPNVIVSGKNGVGKTLIVDLVLKENGIEKIVANFSNVLVAKKTKRKNKQPDKIASQNPDKKSVKETKGVCRSVMTYYMSLNSKKKKYCDGKLIPNRIALVIDDVSTISNSKQRDPVKALIKLNNKLKEFPIIIIANTKHSKTVNELKKMVTYSIKKPNVKKPEKFVNEIVIYPPGNMELIRYIKYVAAREKINFVNNVERYDLSIYERIVDHCQYDVRRLINILEELKLIHGLEHITVEKFTEYCNTSKKKDLDPGIYNATKSLLNNYSCIDTAALLYGEERATIPLMVHENYASNLKLQYPRISVDETLDIMCDVSKSISESDKIDGLIYSNQYWSLQSVHGFYSCVEPSYYVNKKEGKLCSREVLEYTKDYNKTSIKKINNKVIKEAQRNMNFKKVSIHDFLCMAYTLKSMFENKRFEEVATLLKPYKLNIKEIESIIKIDKIDKEKNVLTGKQKNNMSELLGFPVKAKAKSKIAPKPKPKPKPKAKPAPVSAPTAKTSSGSKTAPTNFRPTAKPTKPTKPTN